MIYSQITTIVLIKFKFCYLDSFYICNMQTVLLLQKGDSIMKNILTFGGSTSRKSINKSLAVYGAGLIENAEGIIDLFNIQKMITLHY